MVGLGYLSGDTYSGANGVNADGSVVVGYSFYTSVKAIRWTAAGGMVALGLPYSQAFGVNGDGSVVVGAGGSEAFRWTAAQGMQSIQSLLTAACVNTAGWTLISATAVSGDGQTIVGYGRDPNGKDQAWIAHIAASSSPASARTTSTATVRATLPGGTVTARRRSG
jgi:uncharacterized membrane protein